MNDVAESAKSNPGLIAILALVLTGGGANLLSEGAEDEESEEMATEFRLVDKAQDERHEELDDLYHDLDKRLALLEQAINSL